MNHAILHFFRIARIHQRDHNGGGAADGLHAMAALWSARSTIAFRKRLAKTIKDHKKRSAAAKRGWKKRRQEAI